MPAAEVNELASKEETVTVDLENLQCDMDASVDVKGVLLIVMCKGAAWFQVCIRISLGIWSNVYAIICYICAGDYELNGSQETISQPVSLSKLDCA